MVTTTVLRLPTAKATCWRTRSRSSILRLLNKRSTCLMPCLAFLQRTAAADLPREATPALGAAIAPSIEWATDSICLACNFDLANMAVTARTMVAAIGGVLVLWSFCITQRTDDCLWITRSFDHAVYYSKMANS